MSERSDEKRGGEELGRFGINTGALFILLAAVSVSVYFAFQKPYLDKYGALLLP